MGPIPGQTAVGRCEERNTGSRGEREPTLLSSLLDNSSDPNDRHLAGTLEFSQRSIRKGSCRTGILVGLRVPFVLLFSDPFTSSHLASPRLTGSRFFPSTSTTTTPSARTWNFYTNARRRGERYPLLLGGSSRAFTLFSSLSPSLSLSE